MNTTDSITNPLPHSAPLTSTMSNPGMVTTLLKSLKCEIKIEIQLDEKSISCLIPSEHLNDDKDTGDIISDALCIQTLYGYIVNQASQENFD